MLNWYYEQINEWIATSSNPLLIWLLVVPVVAGCSFAAYCTLLFSPWLLKLHRQNQLLLYPLKSVNYQHQDKAKYHRIAITVDFSKGDTNVINSALAIGKTKAEYILIHIVETAGRARNGQRNPGL